MPSSSASRQISRANPGRGGAKSHLYLGQNGQYAASQSPRFFGFFFLLLFASLSRHFIRDRVPRFVCSFAFAPTTIRVQGKRRGASACGVGAGRRPPRRPSPRLGHAPLSYEPAPRCKCWFGPSDCSSTSKLFAFTLFVGGKAYRGGCERCLLDRCRVLLSCHCCEKACPRIVDGGGSWTRGAGPATLRSADRIWVN
ncbi:uncharacterized protein LY79DRAFT_114414 [Colletotrichum navitas]|uniref:Uncharacterized protein n=1 Tax=Colletotrichum navitas TaxID=681940 RepID=A0AAD8Q4L5_9PEZI|nr:uncharacterized protein LY79DRAFT_114414 [Colletotrichum navitas]KAK1594972.1 hypothetical protein LY79DRAFT_114414 [Colletotrichum navitas]